MNEVKTGLLLGGLSGLFMLMGITLGGERGMFIAFGFALVMNSISYFFSEKLALMMSGAERLGPDENVRLYRRVQPITAVLCQRMGLPMPKLWVLPEESPNAFATGRDPENSSVAVSAGLLEVMNDQELEAVIAHELGHILHRDILISSIAATMAAAITGLARLGMRFMWRRDDDEDGALDLVMIIVAPIAAFLIQMAVSRTREYSADAAAAKYTGSPMGLVNALRKLEGWSAERPMHASPAMSHMYIFPPSLGALGRLFSTHPATEQRIEALLKQR